MKPTLGTKILALSVFVCLSNGFSVPETINIQGTLSEANGVPVSGTYAFSIVYYSDAVGGSEIGAASGETNVSESGKFSIEVLPPPTIFSATQVWYELAIDVADDGLDPADFFPQRVEVHSVPFAHEVIRQGPGSGLNADLLDGVNSSGFASASHPHNLANLAGMVTDNQVPNDITIDHASTSDTATLAEHAESSGSAELADEAVTAMGLSGPLKDPGDRIGLGDEVYLQVAGDGAMELIAGGRRLRLAQQRWFDPENLFDSISPNGSDTFNPTATMNDRGKSLIVWQQGDPTYTQIFRAEFRSGSWIQPSNLSDNSSPDGYSSGPPSVAINNDGTAIIVWPQDVGGIYQIFRSEFRNGTWLDPINIASGFSPPGTNAHSPKVVLNDNDEALVVWIQSDGSKDQVFLSEFREGSWTDPSTLQNNIIPDGQEVHTVDVTLNDNGDSVIVWAEDNDSSISQIYRAERRAGVWHFPSDLSESISTTPTNALGCQVALNEEGEAVVIWVQSGELFHIEYFNGSWTEPLSIPDSSPAYRPRIALNDNGHAVAVWQKLSYPTPSIYRSEYESGAWTAPEPLLDYLVNDSFPQVALSNNGDAVIVWEQVNSENYVPTQKYKIFKSELRNGAWRDPVDLADNISPNGENAVRPQVTMNENGDTIIVWSQYVGGKSQVAKSEYKFGF